ncbi:MAG TPA: asparaginase [Longimicrobiales bacterium]|nr:asparaginase [Longimicrobiales bacterium]
MRSSEKGASVEVLRGGFVESVHRVSVAVVDPAGHLRAYAGIPDMVVFARSAVKPVQAVPIVADGVAERFGWGDAELALACASHSGEPRHVEVARGMLASLGLGEEALACGAHAPFNAAAARDLSDRGETPTRLHNNCSGKHAAMLGLAAAHGWPLRGYHEAEHPVQQRMLEAISHWSSVSTDRIDIAVDGCGVATFALPLNALALTFARLAVTTRSPESPAARLIHAMQTFPELVGGTDRLCTELMRTTRGRIFAKVGAEGIYCAGVPGAEIGVALKVEDGAKRAAEPALIEVLRLLGLLTEEDMGDLDRYAGPDVKNTRGEIVGSLRSRIALETGHG